MARWLSIWIFVFFGLTACSNTSLSVQSVIDGDTVVLSDDTKIRLVQIDAPELTKNECYSKEAKVKLEELLISQLKLTKNSQSQDLKTLTLKKNLIIDADSKSDDKDKYSRLLRYLILKDINLNVELVRQGAATPYFYRGIRGDYAEELDAALLEAQTSKNGMWGNCATVIYTPNEPIETGFAAGIGAATDKDSNSGLLILNNNGAACSSDYRECVPPYPPDLDCGHLRGLGPIHVIGSDPHRLDRDGDGIACESN